MKVLVLVEDDADMRRLIRFTLSTDPRIQVVGEAATAEQAVEVARQAQPDLVVLDHFIDGHVMGLEAAPLVKQVAPEARILLFTSHDLATDAEREPAVDAYLGKARRFELVPTVQRMLGLGPMAA